jgi:hypothetical protein
METKEKLIKKREEIMKQAPALDKIVRGTFIEVYLECTRKKCKCHKAKKYRHGPYYRISYGKGKKVHHIYVPLEWKEKAREWTDNYIKIWEIIEQISQLNIKTMKLKNGRKK